MRKTYKWIKIQVQKSDYIYETPDNGKTITKRRFGSKEKTFVTKVSSLKESYK